MQSRQIAPWFLLLILVNIIRIDAQNCPGCLPSKDSCGKNPEHSRIHSGNSVELDEHPWLALIEYINNEKGLAYKNCMGALISKRYVLLPGHCIASKGTPSYGTPTNVHLGEYDKSNTGTDCQLVTPEENVCNDPIKVIKIQKTIVHPGYSELVTSINDIALIRLDEDAPETAYIAPVCLPESDFTDESSSQGLKLIKAGWGTRNVGELSKDVKYAVSLSIMNQTQCQSFYARHKVTLTDKQLCVVGDKEGDTCIANMNGPLTRRLVTDSGEVRFELVGMANFGPALCGKTEYPEVFVKIHAYLDWILSNIEP